LDVLVEVAVDEYLAHLYPERRAVLEELRQLIKSVVPGVRERISYGTSVIFALVGDLVGFVSQPNHLSFFTMSPRLAKAMKAEITKTHKLSGATIHVTPLLVCPGDQVAVGQPVALCGNSGNTTQPHLHVQVRRAAPTRTRRAAARHPVEPGDQER